MAKGHKSEQERLATQTKRDKRRAKADRAKAAAEARRKAAKRKERLTYVLVVGVVLAVVVGGYLLIRALNDTSDTAAAPEGASGEYGIVLGQEDAPTEVVIYEDFLCPFCAQLEGVLGDQLDTAIEQGDVRVEFRTLNFLSQAGDYSLRAANAFAAVSETAGPEAAKEFHDLVFAEQPSESGPFPDDDFLVEKAVEAGADEGEVRPLIEDLGFEGWVEDGTEAASRDGIRQTPTVLVDGQRTVGESPQQIASEVFAAIG
ncbi:DsbA family protein [Nocardioides coralli]|uniref:DsbA family protein n=1 Tax=Nocardioides coralli TaxID=2872154 RepID=UPI001CA41920|nr:thioredoxin domain-containing protein [Nocardioides coralli]QZY28330.1 DsbA family protein [Nocardioides coralli]